MLLTTGLQAQQISLETIWETEIGARSEEQFFAGTRTSDNSILLVGRTAKRNQRQDGWIVNMAEDGTELWEYISGGGSNDRFNDVIASPGGNYIAVGSTTIDGEKRGWVIKLAADGRKLWERNYGPGITNDLQKVIPTRDGGVLAVGVTYLISQENFDGWLLKLNADGEKQWESSVGGPYIDQLRDVVTLNDGTFITAGISSIDGKKNFDGLLAGFDASGNKLFEQTYGNEGSQLFTSLTIAREGGIAVTGATSDANGKNLQGWLLKLDESQAIQWEKKYSDNNVLQLRSIVADDDGGYLMVGTKAAKSSGDYDELIMKLDRRWKRIWEKSFSFTSVDQIDDLVALNANDYVFVGAKKDDWQKHNGWVSRLKFISPKMRIEKFVYEKVEEWAKRGEFEKTEDYLNRVNEMTRKLKISQLEQEIKQRIKSVLIGSIDFSKFKLSEYDADNETYLLTYQDDEFVLPVPLKEASQFKSYFPNNSFTDIDFILSGDYMRFSQLTIGNEAYNKSYNWNYQNDYPYEPTTINYAFNNIEVERRKKRTSPRRPKAGVDTDIPQTDKKRPNAYALIIGNEDYSTYQAGLSSESDVDFAINDAEIFREYCIKTFGIPARNITYMKNATLAQMTSAISRLEKLIEVSNGQAEVFVYYAGHGFPDEKTKEAYLVPVDVSGANVEIAIKLADLYDSLSKHPSQRITVFLDACFSGAGRGAGLLAMRGVKIRPKKGMVKGNMVVFASSTGDESSGPYYDKQHGLFTFFLLEKINLTRGNLTYKELADHLKSIVPKEAVLVNNKKQTPQVLIGKEAEEQWGNWRF